MRLGNDWCGGAGGGGSTDWGWARGARTPIVGGGQWGSSRDALGRVPAEWIAGALRRRGQEACQPSCRHPEGSGEEQEKGYPEIRRLASPWAALGHAQVPGRGRGVLSRGWGPSLPPPLGGNEHTEAGGGAPRLPSEQSQRGRGVLATCPQRLLGPLPQPQPGPPPSPAEISGRVRDKLLPAPALAAAIPGSPRPVRKPHPGGSQARGGSDPAARPLPSRPGLRRAARPPQGWQD